jgi:uncharacterized protein YlxW (UPF0749 family)
MLSRSAEGTARAQRLIVVSLIAVALGFLLVVQLRSQAAVARTLAAQDDTSVALLINDLNRANNQLIQQGAALSQQEAQLREALTAGGADAQAIQKELTTLREVNGAVPVHGPGIALNGQRIISSTPVQSRGDTLLINGHAVSSPLSLLVIGDPEQLGPAADLSASSLQTRVQVSIQRQTELAITEIVTPRPLIYAQLGK